MALFQRISMLLSIIIFALATRQIIVNGITIDSFSDVCGRNPLPLCCNFSGRNNLQPLDTLGCGSSFMMSRNIDANDIGPGSAEWWSKKCNRLRPQVKKRPTNFNQ